MHRHVRTVFKRIDVSVRWMLTVGLVVGLVGVAWELHGGPIWIVGLMLVLLAGFVWCREQRDDGFVIPHVGENVCRLCGHSLQGVGSQVFKVGSEEFVRVVCPECGYAQETPPTSAK